MDPLLEILLPIARLDDRRRALREEYHRIEGRLKRHADANTTAAAEVDRIETELRESRLQMTKLQNDVRTFENRRDAAQRALDAGAGSAEAAERQRDTCTQRIDELETNVLEVMETLEQLDEDLVGAQAKVVEVHAASVKTDEEYRPRLSEIRKEFDDVTAARNKALPNIPRGERTTYDGLIKRKAYALAPVINEACDACRQVVAYQMRSDLKDGRMATCSGCLRWLYLPKKEPEAE